MIVLSPLEASEHATIANDDGPLLVQEGSRRDASASILLACCLDNVVGDESLLLSFANVSGKVGLHDVLSFFR